MTLMGYSRDWGKLIDEKNLKLTISCQTTFKMTILFYNVCHNIKK
jgi:hypothetical protein